MWEVSTTAEFDTWFAGLAGDGQAEIIAKVELLKLLGPRLGRPHADTLNGSKHPNMKEVRATTAGAVLRIAFAFDPTRSAILLVGGDKGGVGSKRFYKQLIARADALYDAHLKRLKQRKKDPNMAKKFDDLVKQTTTPKTRAKAAARTKELLGELLLAEVRALAGKTQRQVAKTLGIKQPSLSKLEKQSDMQLSTLRKIVAALGGELEVVAKFPKGVVRLKPFDHTSVPTGRRPSPDELQLV